jgi:hypothetical protein
LKKGSFTKSSRVGNQDRRKSLNLCVEIADHRVVVATGVLNRILDFNQGTVEALKTFIGLEVGIRFGKCKESGN